MKERDHAVWFRGEVERGMREAGDPAVRRIPHDSVRSNWRRQRDELEQRTSLYPPSRLSPRP